VSGSGISWAMCKSAPCSRHITMPAPHHSVFLQAGCPTCRPTNSIKALKAHNATRNSMTLTYNKLHRISVTHSQYHMNEWSNGQMNLWPYRSSAQLPIVFPRPRLQCCLLFCVRMMSPVPFALSTMMLCLLKFLKHRVIWSLLLFWRHSTWLGKLYLQGICTVGFENCIAIL